MTRKLHLIISRGPAGNLAAAAGIELLESVIPPRDCETVRRLNVPSDEEVCTLVRLILHARKPPAIVTMTDSATAVSETIRYLAHSHGRELGVLWFDDDDDEAAWRHVTRSLAASASRGSIPPGVILRCRQTRYGLTLSDASGEVEESYSPSRCAQLLRSRNVRSVAVRLGFTARFLFSMLHHSPSVDSCSSGRTTFLRELDEILCAASLADRVSGVCLEQRTAAAIEAVRNRLAQSVLFSENYGEPSDASDASSEPFSPDGRDSLDYADVVSGWLVDGRTSRTLDTWVLGLNGSETCGAVSRAMLEQLGIADEKYRGILRGDASGHILQDLPYAAQLSDLLHARRSPENLLRPQHRAGTSEPELDSEPAASDDPVELLPALERSDREREYNSFSLAQRREVLRRFLFEGEQHRSLDESVLGFDREYSRGFQSMGILHYLGLKKPYRGLFEGRTVAEAISIMRSQPNAEEFSKIIELLEGIADE